MNYYGILIGIILFFILKIVITSSGNHHGAKDKEQFWARESKANAVRRADISNLDYIRLPLERLPLDILRNIGEDSLVDELTSLADKDILNLSMYTNTDLKMMYGPANLDTLIECDNNFTSLIRILDKMAEILLESGQPDHARCILEYAIAIGSDISTTYIHLGDIYASAKKSELLDMLIQKAETLSSLSRQTIINKLNSIKSGVK